MTKRYKNKYRTETIRANWWDYGWNGAYFITICTKNRECFFEDIENDAMQLSPTGVIADICWHEIPNHAKHVELGEYVVMPNHVHGIIMLNKPGDDVDVDTSGDKACLVSTACPVSTPCLVSTDKNGDEKSIGQARFQNQGKNTISSIIGGYKSAVTKHARRMGYHFEWQSRFYDHIIRDEQAFKNISNYIMRNPQEWNKDKFAK